MIIVVLLLDEELQRGRDWKRKRNPKVNKNIYYIYI
jgi:hypothetical protein